MTLDSQKDNIYSEPKSVQPFAFDQQVAAVFPDMIKRSVPAYSTIIDGISNLSSRFYQPNTNAYDLGCSLGAATLAISHGIEKSIDSKANPQGIIHGIDNSEAMVERCKIVVDSYKHALPIKIQCDDILNTDIQNASIVVLNFTLQFVPMAQRLTLINHIYNGLNSGGILILSEKFMIENEVLNKTFIDLHHDFKRQNGYSDLEISQKRNALENVLIPETISTHKARCLKAGFKAFETWQQHLNFASFVAIK